MGMGSNRGSGGRSTMSEINVTPMVDVMLVLLIIFMVTAPLIQQGVKVNLPEARAAPVEASEKK
ncbi:MAG TPA: biopolymer transporter ExbD, partial [Myxococcaceae bacterium]|nr:biopolymer transporter ExbD [Myxococcaceae bacterium]